MNDNIRIIPFTSLPTNIILHHVFPLLQVPDLIHLSATCQSFHRWIVFSCEELWKCRCLTRWNYSSSSSSRNRQNVSRKFYQMIRLHEEVPLSDDDVRNRLLKKSDVKDQTREKFKIRNNVRDNIINNINNNNREKDEGEGEGFIICWYEEYKRRCLLDATVPERLKRLNERRTCNEDDGWCSLLLDGPDILEKLQELAANDSCIEGEERVSYGLADTARETLMGIHRFWTCLDWYNLLKRLQSSEEEVDIDDGAILIARLYQTSSNVMTTGTTLHTLEISVHHALEEKANLLKQRLGQNQQYNETNSSQLSRNQIIVKEMRFFFQSVNEQREHQGLPSADRSDKLRGNITDYYNFNNSLLDQILLNTRKGIPITLSIIYASIVKRATGIKMDAVGIPGHFLISIGTDDNNSRLFVDAFDGGKVLSKQQCQDIVQNHYRILWHDSMSKPVPKKEVWARMLRNLAVCHVQTLDLAQIYGKLIDLINYLYSTTQKTYTKDMDWNEFAKMCFLIRQ